MGIFIPRTGSDRHNDQHLRDQHKQFLFPLYSVDELGNNFLMTRRAANVPALVPSPARRAAGIRAALGLGFQGRMR